MRCPANALFPAAPGSTLTRVSSAGDVVTAYWAAAEARDWERFRDLLAEDVVYEAPQSRERVRGRDAYVRFNAEGFPGDWRITVTRVVGDGDHAASWIEFREVGEVQPGLCFFDLDADGSIARITDFWPEHYEPPAGRGHLVERF
jgi:ketosteroid isomerase-like protein